jgi:hypothetical protein
MNRTLLFAALGFVATVGLNSARGGSIIYNVVNYPALQNGYTVSGTITTNGATGTQLPSTDITSWNITITNGTNSAAITSSNTTNFGQSFDATPVVISVASLHDAISFQTTTTPTNTLIWANLNTGAGEYSSEINSNIAWLLVGPFEPSNPVAQTVPEPSSAVLALIGAGTVVACGLVRQCRAKRRQTAAGHIQPTE